MMVQDYYGKITYFERTYRDEKEKEFLDNLNDAHATSKDCHWHFNHLSGYTGVVNYSRTALAMQGACERALKDEAHKGKPSGVIVMDFAAYKGVYDIGIIDGTKIPELVVNQNKR